MAGRFIVYALTNGTSGGEGVTGHRHTDDAKAKMRASHRGKRFTDAHRAALSRSIAESLKSCVPHHWQGKKHSEVTKKEDERIREGGACQKKA
jgi:hypothetical protein